MATAVPVEVGASCPTGPLPPTRTKPEVLAPAGNWECAKAAVENGADALYFGLSRFNARMRADNFTEADLPELMAFLHRRGVRGYLTFNTLVFADEMAEATAFLRAAIAAGVDAAIVQDAGICRLIRHLSDDFPIHASTQMTITSDAGVAFAKDLGAHLVVLARECSIAEIAKISEKLAAADSVLPLEVFVHGALCVAYSGQCLTSEALGGRSANRGECAQACRLPYELYADGQLVPLGDRRYLLSPQDLAAVDVVPQLVAAGVSSLKIEGRLKTPEYVASITRAYRQAVDACFAGQPTTPTPAEVYRMEMAFSRGLYTGWLRGIHNQELVHARYPHKRGALLGEVVRARAPDVWVRPVGPAKPGDGVVFDLGRPDEAETGARLHRVADDGDLRVLGFHAPDLDWSRVRIGARVWKTSDPALDRELRATFQGDKPRHARPVRLAVFGGVGQPLSLEVRDETGRVVRAASATTLAAAQNQPLTTARLRDQLGRLGGTGLEMADLANHLEGPVILPVSELNQVRREAVEKLLALRAEPPRWHLRDESPRLTISAEGGDSPATTELVLMIRELAQLPTALELAHRDLYAEFEDPKKYREAMEQVRRHREATGRDIRLWVCPPRIFKMGEEWILRLVRGSEPDGCLARNHEHLRAFADLPRRGDFSLNVANPLAAEHFVRRLGLASVTASYDLNIAQLTALLESAPPTWFEVTIHQRMPLFHMEHCVFCAFLSKGKDYHDCGRPCEKHRVSLRDRTGAEHLLRADAGCRNTLYNSRVQTGAEFVPHLLKLGLRRFRLDFMDESPAAMRQTVASYERLLRGELSGDQLWRQLKLHSQLGVTRGTLKRA